jgi:hypothetical protein
VTSVENTVKCFKHWQAAQKTERESESEVQYLVCIQTEMEPDACKTQDVTMVYLLVEITKGGGK